MSFLGDLSSLVVSDMRVQRSDQHQRLVSNTSDFPTVRSDANHTFVSERERAVSQEADGLEKVADHDGFEDVELEVPVGACEGDGGVVAEDLTADHSHGFTLGGVDFAGHDAAAGLVLGQIDFT